MFAFFFFKKIINLLYIFFFLYSISYINIFIFIKYKIKFPMKKECPFFCPEFVRLCQENVRNSQVPRQKSASEFFSRGQMSGICPEFVYVNCKNVRFI